MPSAILLAQSACPNSMKAALYDEFRSPLYVTQVNDPSPANDGIVLEVKAAGVCRSDWHGWMGHDPDICTPNVPGHEMAGIVAATGKDVRDFSVGARVTLPFICACGDCRECQTGNQQVCHAQSQPGFTHWGCFAEFVAIRHADHNLVHLPEAIDYATAASLGCRFATSFRAVIDQGELTELQISIRANGRMFVAKVGEVLETCESMASVKLSDALSNHGFLRNDMQHDALQTLIGIGRKVQKSSNAEIQRDWRRLQSADHFLYMDDSGGNPFNPYENAYDAFLKYMNVLADFDIRVSEVAKKEPLKKKRVQKKAKKV